MDNKDSTSKKFSKGYVLRTTAKHMRKAVDISIRKTFDRIKEYEGDSDKSREIMETLSDLHQMRKTLDDFQSQNKDKFTGE